MSLTRRQFLQCVVISAGTFTVAGLTGCGGGNNDDQDSAGAEAPPLVDGATFFPQSVASGDPRPTSVILWTRAVDTARTEQPLVLDLEVAEDAAFTQLVSAVTLTALPESDYCLRVKLTGLASGRHYYFRYLYRQDDIRYVSRPGRTKTAPAADADVPVRFAFANCQDYIGRYYNTYLRLLEPDHDDLDFIAHLGDYLYETTGDPLFQQSLPERSIRFADEAGAIALGSGDATYFAASSLDNYRQLHRTYRSDPILQRIHERFPMIATWDDHEFSNDHWQDHATYFNGRRNEQDTARKQRAEQAWFEYMPIDDTTLPPAAPVETLPVDLTHLFPNTMIYRDFQFGRQLYLAILDCRTHRPDHLIPEDAFPGTIVLTEPLLRAALGTAFDAVAASLSPYQGFNALIATEQATLTAIVTQLYQQEGLTTAAAAQQAAAVLQGNLDLTYLNLLLTTAGANPLPTAGLPRGISYLLLGKQGLYTSLGSRNLTVQSSFDLFAQILAPLHNENFLGTKQQTWLQNRLAAATATWKVIGSSVSLTAMVLDLTQDPAALPLSPEAQQALTILQTTPSLRSFVNKFYLSVDQWDGFPSKRKELLDWFRGNLSNTVLIAGDIHASFVTDHSTATSRLFEFTGPAISSTTFQGEVINQIQEIAGLKDVPGIDALVNDLAVLIQPVTASPLVQQKLLYTNTGANGVVVVRVDGANCQTVYHLIPGDQALVSYYDNPQAALAQITVKEFSVS